MQMTKALEAASASFSSSPCAPCYLRSSTALTLKAGMLKSDKGWLSPSI